MTARPDLETVKAMLLDALAGSISQWADAVRSTGDDDETTVRRASDLSRRAGIEVSDSIEFSGPGVRSDSWVILDAYKLATAITEWFAAHYEQSSGEKMLAMIRQGGDA